MAVRSSQYCRGSSPTGYMREWATRLPEDEEAEEGLFSLPKVLLLQSPPAGRVLLRKKKPLLARPKILKNA